MVLCFPGKTPSLLHISRKTVAPALHNSALSKDTGLLLKTFANGLVQPTWRRQFSKKIARSLSWHFDRVHPLTSRRHAMLNLNVVLLAPGGQR